jgi:hypothetical protein
VKLKAELSYRDTWTEEIEVEVPAGATYDEARELLRQASERHWPSPPLAKRITPCNLVHEGWAGDHNWPLPLEAT